MSKSIDLVGARFGRLTVQQQAPGPGRRWRCLCDCGAETVVFGSNLSCGKTGSCGCLSAELTSERLRTHGARRTAEYRIWTNMHSRCSNPNTDSYELYGARGIKVCARWSDFALFLADVGPRPSAGHSIERREGDGDYEPSNVVWATAEEQCRNRRSNRWIEFNGERLVALDWARRLGIKAGTIYGRLERGITDPKALLAQPQRRSA